MQPDDAGQPGGLWSEIADHLLSGRMNPAQMKIACYCLRHGYVIPNYMPAEEWRTLDTRLEISAEWLRKSLRDLRGLGLLLRDKPGKRPGYALNPQWTAPPPEQAP